MSHILHPPFPVCSVQTLLGGLVYIVMPLNPYSAGIDFRRQNLTSGSTLDDRRQILTSEVDHRTERIKIFIMAVDP